MWASGTKSGPGFVTWSPWLIQTSVSSGRLAKTSVLSRIARVARPYSRLLARIDFGAEHLAAELHAVADAEDRHAEVEDPLVAAGGAGLVDAGRTAGEDDALERQLRQLIDGCAGREDAGVDVVLADPAGDQLDVLAAEIQDGDHFANHKASCHTPAVARASCPCSFVARASCPRPGKRGQDGHATQGRDALATTTQPLEGWAT